MHRFPEIVQLLSKSSFFYTIAIGLDSRYIYVSKSYDENFDTLKESLLGKHFSITLHPDDVSVCAETGANCLNNPEDVFPTTLRKINGNGGYVITQWEMKAIKDLNNQPSGIFCVGYNITEHIQTREHLVTANSEIANKQNRLKEIGFLQSHGVRRPLANILGLAHMLDDMKLDPEIENVKNMIVDSAHQLDHVIREVSKRTD